jgi:hypothetical protein
VLIEEMVEEAVSGIEREQEMVEDAVCVEHVEEMIEDAINGVMLIEDARRIGSVEENGASDE